MTTTHGSVLPSGRAHRGHMVWLAILVFVIHGHSAAAGGPRLLRFPDVHGESVVFVCGEDIWSAPSSGGVAIRLTVHDGEERFPKYSPDGKLIAFTGEYDGNADVYVMDAQGGGITRVTYHPGYDEVVGWHPRSNKILFRSSRDSFSRFSRLYLVSPNGTHPEPLILHEAATGSFSPDGGRIAYNRVAREHRTWKRYRGGLAQEIYVYDFSTNEELNVSASPSTDRLPMWSGDTIYFSSDRNRVLNIHAFETRSGNTRQITHHEEYDVRRPSIGGDRIVYELGGDLWLLNTQDGSNKRISIDVRADAPETRPRMEEVTKFITGFDCSPSGARAAVVARGELFTVPKNDGPTRNLTKSSGARDVAAAWSPDGKTIAYLSDESGEYEIHIVEPDGKSSGVRLTKHSDGYRHTLRWSPDSKKIAFADQTLRCYYLDVPSKKITEIDKADYENVDVSLDVKPISDFSWSPDGAYIAYSKMNDNLVYNVYIYSVETGERRCVSEGIFNDFGPVFTPNGEHLLFVSNRRFEPTYCDFEWEMVYKKTSGIYALTLRADGDSLLPFKSDEEGTDSGDSEDDEDDKEDVEDDDNAVDVTIDFDGLAARIESLPLPAGNYRELSVNESSVFYLNADEGDFNRFEYRAMKPRALHAFSFDDREERTIIEGIGGYRLSADGSHIVYRKDDSLAIIESSVTKAEGGKLDLSGLKMRLDPGAEWRQIFDEVWRMERDFYYDPGMHGIDWDAMKTKYGSLLERASCRQDIRFIVGELIGELNTSHTYIFGGDRERRAESINVGMLGADWELDETHNRYRFKKIYRVADWTQDIQPPLHRPGLDVKNGDYLLRVNGDEVTGSRNIYSYFQDLAGRQVTLLVNGEPNESEAGEFVVKPLRGERTLRYLDWVERNRLATEQASDGAIGYLHLPDTYLASAREFPKYFYSQTRKKGLVIDGRFNGGGLDPDILLQRLDKNLLALWTRRHSHDQTTPFVVTRAHMACLTNRQAGSGGDMLPMEFQMRGMGPVIGTRTWGGLVGVSMFIQLIDGGGVTAPDYRIYDPQGKWVVENVGIEPDIVVDLHPAEVARGYDAQLMTAINYLLDKIEKEPRPWPEHEPIPVDH